MLKMLTVSIHPEITVSIYVTGFLKAILLEMMCLSVLILENVAMHLF